MITLKKIYLYVTIIVIFIIIYSIFSTNNAFAQNIIQSETQRGLTLSPVRSEFEINPGTLTHKSLTVTNATEKTMSVKLTAEEFSVINQNYDYAFTEESDLVKWVRFDKNIITLQSHQSYTINYTINVPLMTEPGGRYISIFASTESGSSSGIKSKQRVAALLYIEVLGNVSRIGKIISLNTPWLVFGEGDWSATLQNSGTTHYISRYKSSLINFITNDQISNISGDAIILPATVRLVTEKLPNFIWPGIYKLYFEIGLGDSPAYTENRYVLYLPAYVIIATVFCVSIVFFIVNLRKKS